MLEKIPENMEMYFAKLTYWIISAAKIF